MPAKQGHICKFKKITYKSGNQIFFCTLPDCNKKINPALALGKRAVCWRCGNDFILSEYSLRLVKPHCESCHKPKASPLEVVDNDSNITDSAILQIPQIQMSPEVIHHELSLSERMQQIIKPQTDIDDEEI